LRTKHFNDQKDLLCTGATQKAITNEKLTNLTIPLPTLAEQLRIVTTLDRAVALRSQRLESIAQLESTVEACFVHFFGDPVTNLHGWPKTVLGDLLTFQQYGHRFYNEAYSADGIRVIRITDLSESGELDFSEMPRQAVTSEEHAKYMLQPGDLIFARSGATVGRLP